MARVNGRKISREKLAEIRKEAVGRVLAGESPEKVIGSIGFERARIYGWLSKFRSGGWPALEARRAKGRSKKITASHAEAIFNFLKSPPQKYGFERGLWTKGLVGEVIQQRLSLQVSMATVRRLLKFFGLIGTPTLLANWDQRDSKCRKLSCSLPRSSLHPDDPETQEYFYHEVDMTIDFSNWERRHVRLERGKLEGVVKSVARWEVIISKKGEVMFLFKKLANGKSSSALVDILVANGFRNVRLK